MGLDGGDIRGAFDDFEEQQRRRRRQEEIVTAPGTQDTGAGFVLPALPEPVARPPVVHDPSSGLIDIVGPTLRALPGPTVPAPTPAPAPGSELIFSDPATRMLEEFTRRRFSELQLPPFTPTEENVRRAAVFDELERQRQNAHRQAIERLATLGHARTSGIFEDTARRIDEAFDRVRTERERDLFLSGITRRDQQQREALALATLLPELVERRLQLATGTLTGAAPNPTSIFQQIAQMVGQTQQADIFNAQQSNQSNAALGQIIGLLLSSGQNLGLPLL